jgi:hypothetical protein
MVELTAMSAQRLGLDPEATGFIAEASAREAPLSTT